VTILGLCGQRPNRLLEARAWNSRGTPFGEALETLPMTNCTLPLITACLLVFASKYEVAGQGTFQNLDFESAKVPDVPISQGGLVYVTNGVPGWAIFPQITPGFMGHNTLPLGGAAVIIFGPQWPTNQILEGKYTVGLFHSTAGQPTSALITQTGQVPGNAKSVRFYGGGFFDMSFAGQQIPVVNLGEGSNYTVFGGDISAFAGQIGELQFVGNGFLDKIQFSDLAIPEPSVFALCMLGVIILGYRHRQATFPNQEGGPL